MPFDFLLTRWVSWSLVANNSKVGNARPSSYSALEVKTKGTQTSMAILSGAAGSGAHITLKGSHSKN